MLNNLFLFFIVIEFVIFMNQCMKLKLLTSTSDHRSEQQGEQHVVLFECALLERLTVFDQYVVGL
jgi:hypothetical protein